MIPGAKRAEGGVGGEILKERNTEKNEANRERVYGTNEKQ